MITDKIILLNETVLECLKKNDQKKVISTFTEVGIKVLGADFGFVWLNSSDSENWSLVYKSKNLPYNPSKPKDGGRNLKVLQSSIPEFVSRLGQIDHNEDHVEKHLKSFVIIPLVYRKAVYGNMTIGFKKRETFPKKKKTLSVFIGNSVAQAITIHRLLETKVFLEQEKTKNEFMGNAMHELRTPVAIMKGNVDLVLMDSSLPKSVKEKFKTLNSEIDILSRILKDLVLFNSTYGHNR